MLKLSLFCFIILLILLKVWTNVCNQNWFCISGSYKNLKQGRVILLFKSVVKCGFEDVLLSFKILVYNEAYSNWFWIVTFQKNILLMLVFLKASFLVLQFSYYT